MAELWHGYLFPTFWILGGILVIVIPLLVFMALVTYAERKVIAAMQFRKGPNVVGPFGLLRVVNNIDEVKIKGFEFAARAKLHDYFTVSAGFNVTDSEIKNFASRPDTVGNKSPYTPDFTINLSGEFRRPVRSCREPED